jgi:hypothetical protein
MASAPPPPPFPPPLLSAPIRKTKDAQQITFVRINRVNANHSLFANLNHQTVVTMASNAALQEPSIVIALLMMVVLQFTDFHSATRPPHIVQWMMAL